MGRGGAGLIRGTLDLLILQSLSTGEKHGYAVSEWIERVSDGRLLVADPLGNALYVVDLDAGTRMVLGGTGQGPGEYQQPDAVWELPDGESLVVDLGNGRNHVLGPDLRFGETTPIAVNEPRPGSTLVLALPQAVDAAGRVYARAMGGLGGAIPDSAAILRIDRATRAIDSLATFKLEDRTESRSGSANNQSVQIRPIPLSPVDAWGVAPDGSVAVARSGDYHLEWISPDGSVTRGPSVSYDPIRIGTAEKEEYVTASGRSGGGIGISVMMSNGSMQMSFSRGGPGRSTPREIDQYQWPDVKPPFYSDRILIDAEHRAWVRRHVDAGEDTTYDIFDRDGTRVETVTLPDNKQIVGFGARSIYVVSFDELDLSYLERYPLPTT